MTTLTLLNTPPHAVLGVAGDATPEVTLYDSAGRSMRVASDQAEYFIREHGFSRVPVDPAARLAAMEPLWPAARDAVRRAVQQVTETGQIETHPDAAWHTATLAFDALTRAFGALHRDLHTLYPTVNHE